MKLLLKVLAFVCLSVPMWGQGYRYDSNAFTSANNVPAGSQSTMFTVPFAKITVCAYPDNGSQPCTNTVSIFQDPALTVAAVNPITADVHGRFGFWKAAGTYTFSMVSPDGTFLGTFVISLGGGGTGGCGTGSAHQICFFSADNSAIGDSLFSDTGSSAGGAGGLIYTGNGIHATAPLAGFYEFLSTDTAAVSGGSSFDVEMASNGSNGAGNITLQTDTSSGTSANTNSGNIRIYTAGNTSNGNNINITAASTINGGSGQIIADASGGMTLRADSSTILVQSAGGIDVFSGSQPTTLKDGFALGEFIFTVADSPYTMGSSGESTAYFDASGGAITANLPTPAFAGTIYIIQKVDASASAITVTAPATYNIDGVSTYTLTSQWQSVILQYDSNTTKGWHVIGTNGSGGGGLSGQTTGYLPLATSATASTTSSALQDTGSSLVYHGTGTQHGLAFPASSGGLITPVAGNAGIGTDASGLWSAYENGGSWSRLCTVGNALCSAGGGGTSNPSTCTVSDATNICITLAPYYASGNAGATTTSGTTSPGTSVTLTASCSATGFDSATAGAQYGHQGVYIAGAGAAGVNYIGTVSTCVGSTMTLAVATSTSVAGGAVLQHDDTNAFTAAFAALNPSSGTIWLPRGQYLINGPLQDTGGANAILPVPVLPNYGATMVNIAIEGLSNTQPVGGFQPSDAVIVTSANTGNLIGGYDAATGGGFAPFTNVHLTIQNVAFVLPSNPGIVAVNATNIIAFEAAHVGCYSQDSSLPSNTAGGCFYLPRIDNNVELALHDVYAVGVYTGFIIPEHSGGEHVFAYHDVNCFVLDNNGTDGTYHGDTVSISNMWGMQCTHGIVGGTHQTTVNIQSADFENTGTDQVSDPSNSLRGVININIPQNGVGVGSLCAGVINGAAYVNIKYLNCANSQGVYINPSGGYGTALSFAQANATSPVATNAFLSNPSAGVLSADTTTPGNALGAMKMANLTDSALTSGNLICATTGGLLTTSGCPGSSLFSAIGSGTNTTAAMVVGSGASLAPTGTGSIQATNIASTVAVSSPITVTGSGTTASPYTIACPTCGTGAGGTSVSQNSGSAETNLPITGYMPQVCSDSSGSGTVQSCTVANTFVPQAGNCMVYKTTTANSGTGLTVNVNSLGAKSVAVAGSSGWTTTLVASSSIPANKPLNLCYDGTNWNASGTGYAPSSTNAAMVNITSLVTVSGCAVSGNSCVVSTPGNSVTFSSIPGTYTHLMIVEDVRVSDSGVDLASIILQANGDTASNYGSQQFFGNVSTSTAAAIVATTGFTACLSATGTSTANLLSGCTLWIYDYAGTSFGKQLWGASGSFKTTTPGTTWYNYDDKGWWNNTAAITSINLHDGSGGNFIAGSKFEIFALP